MSREGVCVSCGGPVEESTDGRATKCPACKARTPVARPPRGGGRDPESRRGEGRAGRSDGDREANPSAGRKGRSSALPWILAGVAAVLVVCGGGAAVLFWAVGQVRDAAQRQAQQSAQLLPTQSAPVSPRPTAPDPQPAPTGPFPVLPPPPEEKEWGPNPWKADDTRPAPVARGNAPQQPDTSSYKKDKPFDTDPKLAQGPDAVYLADLEPFAVQLGPWKLGRNGALGSTDDKWVVVNKVYADHALSMHPPADGASRVSFAVGGKARTLRGHVGVDDSSGGNVTPVTFVVLADGKEVWWSRPLQERTATIPFSADVTGAQVVTLEVRCPGSAFGAHCVWLDPELVK